LNFYNKIHYFNFLELKCKYKKQKVPFTLELADESKERNAPL